MTDTPPYIEQKVREMFLQKTGEERLKMGCSMHDLSKQLVINSLQNQGLNLSAGRLRCEIFLKFYGSEFNPEQRGKIMKHLLSQVD